MGNRIGNKHIPCCDQTTRIPARGPYTGTRKCPVCRKDWVVTLRHSPMASMKVGYDVWRITWTPADQWEQAQVDGPDGEL